MMRLIGSEEGLGRSEGKRKLCLRRMLVEHPFGTIKRAFNRGYLFFQAFLIAV